MDDLKKTTGQWAKTRLAHEAMMLQDAQQTLAINRENQKAQHAMTHGTPPNPKDDMIHIGDVIQNLPTTQTKPGLSTIATIGLIAAALMAGGFSATTIAPMIFNQAPAMPTPPQPDLAPQEFEIEWEFRDGKMELSKPKRVN